VNLTTSKSQLGAALAMARAVADAKSTVPILANVLLRATEGGLAVAATDLAVTTTSTVEAEVLRAGAVTVAAKQLHDIVRALDGSEVELEASDRGMVSIRSGRAAFKLAGLPAADFPRLPAFDMRRSWTIEAAVLLDLIDQTSYAASPEEARYHLAGVLCTAADGKLCMVAIDGHRLSLCVREAASAPAIEGLLIPRRGLAQLRRLCEEGGELRLQATKDTLFASAATHAVAVKLIEAKFPEYERILPRSHPIRLELDRESMMAALKRALIMSPERTGGIRLELAPGVMAIAAENPELGDGREDIEVAYDGAPLAAGFNARYFIDWLAQADDGPVVLELGGPLDPAALSQGDRSYLGVIMPMRL
jgi:DNA polymerase-3 subunit beta